MLVGQNVLDFFDYIMELAFAHKATNSEKKFYLRQSEPDDEISDFSSSHDERR